MASDPKGKAVFYQRMPEHLPLPDADLLSPLNFLLWRRSIFQLSILAHRKFFSMAERLELTARDRKFEPYALAIGQLALTWNDLHEEFGALFAQSLGPEHGLQGGAIWGAVTSDRQKRLLLDASINFIGPEFHTEFPRLGTDVLWATERANSLEDKRNDVIHSPLIETTGLLFAALAGREIGEIHPSGLWNWRAQKLSKAITGKDLLTEIGRYREYAQDACCVFRRHFHCLAQPSEAVARKIFFASIEGIGVKSKVRRTCHLVHNHRII